MMPHTNASQVIKASILIAISAILYGFLGFLGTRVLQENMSVATMLFWRFFIAGLWMLVFILIRHWRKPALQPVHKLALIYMFVLGAIGYAASSFFYFIASLYVGTGLAMVIFFSYPVLVAVFSWIIYRKSLALISIFTLLTMVLGLYLLQYSPDREIDIIGILFATAAATGYAIYVMGSKKVSSLIMDSYLLTAVVAFSCALIFLIFSLLSHGFVFPHGFRSWVLVLGLGILATALPIQLMLKGMRYVSCMRASIISVLEPLVTVAVGIMLLGESVSPLQIVGGFIILASALMIQFAKEL